jgi:hypothetical protein
VTTELPLADYARLIVAVERGDIDGALARYKLGSSDLERLQRSWTERASTDAKLARELAEAIEAARWE